MPNVTYLRKVGNNLQAVYDDGSLAWVYPTNTNLWIKGLTTTPLPEPSRYVRELIADLSVLGAGIVDWVVRSGFNLVIGVRRGTYTSPTQTDVYYSHDEGLTWELADLPMARRQIWMPKVAGGKLFLNWIQNTAYGSFVSSDNGETFVSVVTGATRPHIYTDKPGGGYAFADYGAAYIYHSTDGINFPTGSRLPAPSTDYNDNALQGTLFRWGDTLLFGRTLFKLVSGSGATGTYDMHYGAYSEDDGSTWALGELFHTGLRSEAPLFIGGDYNWKNVNGTLISTPYHISDPERASMRVYLGSKDAWLSVDKLETRNYRGSNHHFTEAFGTYFYESQDVVTFDTDVYTTPFIDASFRFDDVSYSGQIVSAAIEDDTGFYYTFFENNGSFFSYYRLVKVA